jgi:protein dithiol oxidoreductase (disulfide-forming)
MSRIFLTAKALQFFTVLVTSFFIATVSAQVKPLDPPQPVSDDGTIEVLEFFAYGCGGCAAVEPALEIWSKALPPDVKFRRVPSGFNLLNIDDISLFYTLEAMGKLDALHSKIFDAAHTERVMLGHRPTLLKWLEKKGVDTKQYETIEKSFSVQSKIMRGRGLANQYKITTTPTLVVNGRFQVNFAGSPLDFLNNTVNRLIEDVRRQNAAQQVKKDASTKKAPPPKAAAPKATAPKVNAASVPVSGK